VLVQLKSKINESVLYRKKSHSIPQKKLDAIESYIAFV
jgi:hypothetical protein